MTNPSENPFEWPPGYKIESEEIVPKTRKLKATWTYEAQQDLQAWAVNDLTKTLADEINAEIDREVLEDLKRNAEIEKTYQFKAAKKKHFARSITDDFEVSKID